MLSVVIATLNDEEALARSLASLVPAAADGTIRDVIVTDGGSRDATLVVADAAGCVVSEHPGTRAERLKFAASDLARGDFLLFLKPGVLLEAGFSDEIAMLIDRRARRGQALGLAAVFTWAADVEAGWGERLRHHLRALSGPSPDQGLLISRAIYRDLGGHRPVSGDEDRDLYRRIGARRLVKLKSRAVRALL